MTNFTRCIRNNYTILHIILYNNREFLSFQTKVSVKASGSDSGMPTRKGVEKAPKSDDVPVGDIENKEALRYNQLNHRDFPRFSENIRDRNRG